MSNKIWLCAVFILSAAAGPAATIYSNVDPSGDLGISDVFADTGMIGFGDEISFAPGARSLTLVRAALVSFNDPVTADITLRFHELLGVAPFRAPGAVLAAVTLSAVEFQPNTRTELNFTGWNLILPDEVIWSLTLSNASSGQLGLPVFTPPSIGTSNPGFTFWFSETTFFRTSFGSGTDDYFLLVEAAEASPVPEPGTLWTALAALVLGCPLRWRFVSQNTPFSLPVSSISTGSDGKLT